MALILCIDDEPEMRKLISRILTEAGHEVIEASDGALGLRLFRERQPDLVLCDIYMPVKEGIETIFEMRRDSPAAKIVAVSGGGSRGNLGPLTAAGLLGANVALAKPFRAAQLLEVCETLLARDSD